MKVLLVIVLISVLCLCQAMPHDKEKSDDKKDDHKDKEPKSDDKKESKSDDKKDAGSDGPSTLPPNAGSFGEHDMSPPPNITVGGVSEIPPEDHAEVLEHLKVVLPRLSTGATGTMELVTVTKITKQVVSGYMYEVEGDFKVGDKQTHCTISIWVKGWMDKPEEKYKVKGWCNDQSATWRPTDDKEDW